MKLENLPPAKRPGEEQGKFMRAVERGQFGVGFEPHFHASKRPGKGDQPAILSKKQGKLW